MLCLDNDGEWKTRHHTMSVNSAVSSENVYVSSFIILICLFPLLLYNFVLCFTRYDNFLYTDNFSWRYWFYQNDLKPDWFRNHYYLQLQQFIRFNACVAAYYSDNGCTSVNVGDGTRNNKVYRGHIIVEQCDISAAFRCRGRRCLPSWPRAHGSTVATTLYL